MEELLLKEPVILEMSDWNMQEKFYELPLGILKEFHQRIKDNGIEESWSWFVAQVDYDGEGLPIKYGKVDMSRDRFFLDWSQVDECMAEWDEFFEE